MRTAYQDAINAGRQAAQLEAAEKQKSEESRIAAEKVEESARNKWFSSVAVRSFDELRADLAALGLRPEIQVQEPASRRGYEAHVVTLRVLPASGDGIVPLGEISLSIPREGAVDFLINSRERARLRHYRKVAQEEVSEKLVQFAFGIGRQMAT